MFLFGHDLVELAACCRKLPMQSLPGLDFTNIQIFVCLPFLYLHVGLTHLVLMQMVSVSALSAFFGLNRLSFNAKIAFNPI